MTPLFRQRGVDVALREAAWVARCVGRSDTAPLREPDLVALAAYLSPRQIERGAPLFSAGRRSEGVWIVRDGLVELIAGSGRRRLVVQLLRPGDVDGDMQLLLDMPLPYTARAVTDTRCLFLEASSFERLLHDHPAVARRWLSSVAARVSRSQNRIVALLGRSLAEQIARLLIDESIDGVVRLPQRTLASMLGVQRPSLNKVLKDLERRGVVDVRYGEVHVRQRDALERIASRAG